MPGIAEVIDKHLKSGKPVVPVMLGGGKAEEEEREKLAAMKLPVYPSPVRGVKTLAALVKYSSWKRGGVGLKSD
jgi:acyl-CoA synthetase (NDP forming)